MIVGNRERFDLMAPLADVHRDQGGDAVPDLTAALVREALEGATGVLSSTDRHRDGEADAPSPLP